MGESVREISFTAIDFETANSQRGSVCAVGLARVVEGEIVERASWLIKPPRGYDHFEPRNVGIHGIRAQDVLTARNWEESLASIFQFAAGGHFVAYNARFDSSVMRAASEAAGVDLPKHDFYCALDLARGHLDIPRHKLNDVTEHLELPAFKHHEAGADAIACASVVLAIARTRQLRSTAEMWAAPIGAKGAKTVKLTDTRTPVGGQINYTNERTLRLADLPQPNLSADPDHPFFGQTFCFTGELQSFSRLSAMAAVASCGATNRQGITKKTTYVVVGRSDSTHSASLKDLGTSGKERKALDYIALGQQITVLGEREFIQLLGAKVGGKVLPPARTVEDGPRRARPTSPAGKVSRPNPATTAPNSRFDGTGVRDNSKGLDKPTEGPRWLVNLKKVFRLN